MTSSNALRLLVKSGFVVKDKWTELTSLLGVSLEEKRLKRMASSDQDYHFALKEGLQWWITNSTDPSWEELISAVENCGDKDIAVIMREEVKSEGIVCNKCTQYYYFYCIDTPTPSKPICTDFVQDTSSLTPPVPKPRKRHKKVGHPSSLTPPVPKPRTKCKEVEHPSSLTPPVTKPRKRHKEVEHPSSLTPPVPKPRTKCKEVEHPSSLTSSLPKPRTRCKEVEHPSSLTSPDKGIQ